MRVFKRGEGNQCLANGGCFWEQELQGISVFEPPVSSGACPYHTSLAASDTSSPQVAGLWALVILHQATLSPHGVAKLIGIHLKVCNLRDLVDVHLLNPCLEEPLSRYLRKYGPQSGEIQYLDANTCYPKPYRNIIEI